MLVAQQVVAEIVPRIVIAAATRVATENTFLFASQANPCAVALFPQLTRSLVVHGATVQLRALCLQFCDGRWTWAAVDTRSRYNGGESLRGHCLEAEVEVDAVAAAHLGAPRILIQAIDRNGAVFVAFEAVAKTVPGLVSEAGERFSSAETEVLVR